MVARRLDEVGPGAREVGPVQPAGELGPGHDRVGVHAHRRAADEGAGRVGVDVGLALGDRLGLAPLLGAGRVTAAQHPLDLVLEFLVHPRAVLGAPLRTCRRTGLRSRSRCLLSRARPVRRTGQSSCSAPGLCTAVPPLFSLSTSYCGSSSLARTVRPDASVSSVIFRSTVPSAVAAVAVPGDVVALRELVGHRRPPSRRRSVLPCPARAGGRAHTSPVPITRSGRDLTPRGSGSGRFVT